VNGVYTNAYRIVFFIFLPPSHETVTDVYLLYASKWFWNEFEFGYKWRKLGRGIISKAISGY